ncbi:MAG: glycosyltransferase family 2 protein [Chthoniobacterales bacterium]
MSARELQLAKASLPAVSIVTVAYDTFFFVRLLVEKVREFIGERAYEIVLVDRGSRDGTLEWARAQADVRIVAVPQTGGDHGHAEAAEEGVRVARHEIIVLLDSDAHPVSADWLAGTADGLDENCRLAGPKCVAPHRENPYGWYVHPHFMVFYKADLGDNIILRKMRGDGTDTGEEATIRLLDRGLKIEALPFGLCPTLPAENPYRCDFGHPHYPTVSAGVFHAWYGTRVHQDDLVVRQETNGAISRESYQRPLLAMLRRIYSLSY